MATATPRQPWDSLTIPIADPAELEAMVSAAEGMTEQALWQVLSIRAARVRALAEEARATVLEMTQLEERACRPDYQGEQAMTTLSYRVRQVALLARQSRRQLAAYLRQRARLEAKHRTAKGSTPS